MSTSNLRPDLKIFQQFTTVAGQPQPSNLLPLIIGINRALNVGVDTQVVDWNAGTSLSATEFPQWRGGVVESSGFLAPKIKVTNSFGTAQITSGVTFAGLTTAPTFAINSGVSATFEVSAGVNGSFALNADTPLVSTFTDVSADWVFEQVSAGDVIKIAGVPTYQVVALTADDTLSVKRIDKGPGSLGSSETAKVFVSKEDSNNIRILYSRSTAFNLAGGFNSTKVKVGDTVALDHWSTRYQGAGLEFTQVGELAGETVGAVTVGALDRVATLPVNTFTGGLWNNTTKSGSVFFLQNASNTWQPAFYAVSAKQGSYDYLVRDYATKAIDSFEDADEGEGVAYRVYNLTARAGAGSSGTGGEFSAADASGNRLWQDPDIVAFGATISTGDFILIKDTDGIYRPAFTIVGFGTLESPSSQSPTVDNIAVVKAIGNWLPDNVNASNVDYVVCNPGAATQYAGASVTAETAGKRVLTVTGEDFTATQIAVGDLIFNDNGYLMFTVTGVGGALDDDELEVADHPNAGVILAPTDTIAALGFSVRRSLRADFTVRRVFPDGERLEIRQLPNSLNNIPDSKTIKGSVYFQTPIDVDEDEYGSDALLITTPAITSKQPYTIEKTLSGASLSGNLTIDYAEILNTESDFIIVTASTVAANLGAAVPHNPLALLASKATQNTDTEVLCLQVHSDDEAGWVAAFDRAKDVRAYSIVPATQEDYVLALAQAHVIAESLPDNKRERILWQSKWHKQQYDRTQLEAGDNPLVSYTVGGPQTITVDRDLSESGVIVGDMFEGTAFNGSSFIEFNGRILTLSTAPGTSTFTIIPDTAIPSGSIDLVISDYTIKSKLLTLEGLRDAIADYSATIANRRIRNIYPSRSLIDFVDTTGWYGAIGATVKDYEVGGEVVAAIEAAKRARFGPSQPLTGVSGSGIKQIIDPFRTRSTYQDVIIDSGNYYMQQLGGIGASVSAIRALSTDVTSAQFYEDQVTTQVDNFARLLRASIRPILGPNRLDSGFFQLLSGVQQAVRNQIIRNNQMAAITLIDIKRDEEAPDSFILSYEVVPFFSAARGTVFIYV